MYFYIKYHNLSVSFVSGGVDSAAVEPSLVQSHEKSDQVEGRGYVAILGAFLVRLIHFMN